MTDSRRRVTPPGHGSGLWDGYLDRLPRLTVPEIARSLGRGPGSHLLVVAAHPDDETLGAGRLIAGWADQVGPVSAVTLTAGEACVSQIGVDLPGIADRRRREWGAAVAVLGARDHGVAGLPDGGLPAAEDGVTEEVSRVVDLTAPDLVIGTAANDPHGDHATVGRAVGRVAADRGVPWATFPVWMKYWMGPEDLTQRDGDLVVIDCGPDAEQRRTAAWAAYPSQSAPLRDDLHEVVPAEMAALLTEQLLFIPPR